MSKRAAPRKETHESPPELGQALSLIRERPDLVSRVVAWLLLVVYAWNVWVTTWAHEPWRDEAQAWLYARDAGLAELFYDLRFEAHPALWYLMLLPFAKAGFSFDAMRLLHYGVVLGVMALFLFRAPLPMWLKAASAFSFYFFWQYAMEMRVYAIGFLLMFAVAWLYERRFDHPFRYAVLVFLLSNTNVHMVLVGAALVGAYALELLLARTAEPRKWAAVGVMALGVLLCLVQVGLIGGGTTHRYVYNFNEVHKYVVGAFFAMLSPGDFLIPAGWLFLALTLLPFASRPISLLIVTSILVANFVIALYKGSGLRHYGVVPLTLMWGYWIARSEPDRWALPFPKGWSEYGDRLRIACLVLGISAVICLPVAFQLHDLDRRLDFSGTARMADYLKRNGLLDKPIAVHRYWHLSSLPLYLPGATFWNVALDRRVTFVRQDHATVEAHQMPYDRAILRAMQAVPPPQPLYLLLDAPLDLSKAGFEMVYKVDQTVFGSDERCYLYRRR
ncbi:MAG: hypothetical protein NZ740_00455 [Kiritimatiellae bacterium]|nr:hypothetical protein [Kiritimatiellia bacterium]MDW8457560.1 hypothetical protein [Verrucomicrobiota bacterium]